MFAFDFKASDREYFGVYFRLTVPIDISQISVCDDSFSKICIIRRRLTSPCELKFGVKVINYYLSAC